MFKILLIDDDPIIGIIHGKLLDKQGYSNYIFYQEAEYALDFLKSNQNLDCQYLILLDINMPGMNGWEFISKVKKLKNFNHCLIYLVTSSVDIEDKIRAGDLTLIEKPLKGEQLKLVLNHFEKVFI